MFGAGAGIRAAAAAAARGAGRSGSDGCASERLLLRPSRTLNAKVAEHVALFTRLARPQAIALMFVRRIECNGQQQSGGAGG